MKKYLKLLLLILFIPNLNSIPMRFIEKIYSYDPNLDFKNHPLIHAIDLYNNSKKEMLSSSTETKSDSTQKVYDAIAHIKEQLCLYDFRIPVFKTQDPIGTRNIHFERTSQSAYEYAQELQLEEILELFTTYERT